MNTASNIFSYRKHWAHKLGPAPELPMSREEMDLLGWVSCDVVIVTGDAHVDHPSFGMAIASAMYHTVRNPLRKVMRGSEQVSVVRKLKQRRLHKAFLRYHAPDNWPLLRQSP
jgi:hypothetical protein